MSQAPEMPHASRNEPASGRENGSTSLPGSLAEWAAERRQQLLEEQTVILGVPGIYHGRLAVEFRAISLSETRALLERSERVPDETVRDLYQRADQLIAASINAYELRHGQEARELGHGWGLELAHDLGIKTADLTPRQAVLACFEGTRGQYALLLHSDDYSSWLREAATNVDEQQKQDFQVTT